MAKLPCIHFYPGDWLRDQVSGCSLAAQGLWLRMMMVMHDADRYGYLSMNGVAIPPEHVARRCGITLEQYTTLLVELDAVGVPRRNDDGIIFSKRMVEDAKLREIKAKAGRKGGKQKASNLFSKIEADTVALPEDEVDLEAEVESEKDPPEKTPQQEFISAWDALGRPFAKIKDWNSKRKQLFRVRWSEKFFRENWQEALQIMSREGWCRGETERGWVANVEYFLRAGNVAKFIESKEQKSSGFRVVTPKKDPYEGIPT